MKNKILLNQINIKKPVYFLNFYIRIVLFSSLDKLNNLALILCSNQKLLLEKTKTGIVCYG